MSVVRSDDAGYVQVVTRRRFTCGRKTGGTVTCWSGSANRLPIQTQFDPDGTPNTGDERPYTFPTSAADSCISAD